jgi:hypothetical protein
MTIGEAVELAEPVEVRLGQRRARAHLRERDESELTLGCEEAGLVAKHRDARALQRDIRVVGVAEDREGAEARLGQLAELRDELDAFALVLLAAGLQKIAGEQEQVRAFGSDPAEDLALVGADLFALQIAEHDDLDRLRDLAGRDLVARDLEVEGFDIARMHIGRAAEQEGEHAERAQRARQEPVRRFRAPRAFSPRSARRAAAR